MNARERNVPVGGHIIREKALDFAKELEITDFRSYSISNCLWRGKIMHCSNDSKLGANPFTHDPVNV